METSAISFGVNQTISCKLPLAIYDPLTLTDISCKALQDKLKTLSFSNSLGLNIALGIFGNPHVSKKDDWISASTLINFDQIKSEFESPYCKTITGIQVMIYYSYVVS